MEYRELRKLTDLEERHWWYSERRSMLTRLTADISPSLALDIGAAGGGNSRALLKAGWDAVAVEYSAEAALIASRRGVKVVRADGLALPFPSRLFDLVVAFDVLEHVEEDDVMASEIERVLQPGGLGLIAVPADMRLWSEHDVAVSHVRRYSRESLVKVLTDAGLEVEDIRSWNVLLRPVAAHRRKNSKGSDLTALNPLLNFALRTVVASERYLPVSSLPGVSLVARVRLA